MAKIKIYDGDLVTEELVLTDNGHAKVKRGRNIKWKLVESENSTVASINDVRVESGAEILSELPHFRNGKWRAKMRHDADERIICKYSISWTPKGATEALEHDPQISVKPSSIIPIPVAIAVAFLGFLSLGYCFNKISKLTLPTSNQ